MGSLLILIGRGEEDDGGGVLLLTDSCGRLLVLGLYRSRAGTAVEELPYLAWLRPAACVAADNDP